MLQQISNGRILTAEGWLNDGSIVVEDGKILAVSNNALPVEGAKQIDAKDATSYREVLSCTSMAVAAVTSWKVQKKPSVRQ